MIKLSMESQLVKMKTNWKYPLTAVIVIILAVIFVMPLFAGPGETDDPLVSLSYLQTVSRLGEIQLRKNEEFPMESGMVFILVDGKAELRGVGDYVVIDLTIGKSYKRGNKVTENHLFVVTGGSDVNLVARKDVKVLINGGDANPLRHGM
jgi:hypothetical protein